MFSITTMASSTRIPTTSESPSKDIMLSEKPMRFIPIKVAISETGMATITMREFRRLCRKKSMITATSRMARKRSNTTALADFSV
ncbi:hypothetical protein D9M69_478530 [compost metagenome]